MSEITSTKIFIQPSQISQAGRGVFARTNIKNGEVIEVCPVLVLPQKDYSLAKQTILRNYYFMWGKSTAAMCLEFGSLYNHSYSPNATYKKLIKDMKIKFIALRDIEEGEEVLVNYNYGNPDDTSKLWIEDIPS